MFLKVLFRGDHENKGSMRWSLVAPARAVETTGSHAAGSETRPSAQGAQASCSQWSGKRKMDPVLRFWKQQGV